ncbi:MAG: 4'-phosphopantetheinyl transferase family protein [Flavobacteriales bacterium]
MIVLVEDFMLPHLQLGFANLAEANLDEQALIGPERKQYNSLTNQQRKKTFLGVRMLRKALKINAPIIYLPSGKPVLHNTSGHISISHTKELVALATSEQPIGIDIEEKTRDCMRVINKFVSAHDKILYQEQQGNWPLEVWCAKEAVYKLYDLPGLSFKDEIIIEQRNDEGKKILLKGTISRLHPSANFEVQLLQTDQLLIAVAYFIAAL